VLSARGPDLVLNISEQIQREGGQSVSRLGGLDHSLLVKIPFLAAFPPLWAFPRIIVDPVGSGIESNP